MAHQIEKKTLKAAPQISPVMQALSAYVARAARSEADDEADGLFRPALGEPAGRARNADAANQGGKDALHELLSRT